MKRFRVMIGLGAVGLGLGGAIVAACGGSDLTLCGPGTTNVGGICQIDTTDGSTTDVAVGPDGTALDADPPGDGSVAPDGSDAGAPPNRCPFGKGPVMAEIPNPGTDAGTFCIDATEVTEAEYDQFLKDKNGNTGGQILACQQNTDYKPYCQFIYTFNPSGNPDLPVRCVDWCDAKAFCDWSGKKLCDQLSGTDGPTKTTSRAYWACTNGGGTTHPQGTQSDSTCWLPNSVDAGPVKVASVGCKGKFKPYDQTNDLLGNVAEWQSYCEPDSGIIPGAFNCAVFGASYLNFNEGAGCGATTTSAAYPRYQHGAALGFRCCAD